jgi:hypothetical protein
MQMPGQRKHTYRVAVLNVTKDRVRRFWLTVLVIGGFCFFGYYYFAEVWPALLRAGSG